MGLMDIWDPADELWQWVGAAGYITAVIATRGRRFRLRPASGGLRVVSQVCFD